MATCDVRYGFLNLVDQSTTDITASSENAFFPATNIQSPFSSKVFRSETGTAAANVVFDFKTAEPVDMILIRPDLENGFGFTGALTIEANTIDSWGAPAYSTTLTPNSEYNLGVKILAAAESYRFWRVSGTGTTYFELSNLFIGESFQAERNFSLNWSYENMSLDKITENEFGNAFITINGRIKQIQAEHKLLDKDGMQDWDRKMDEVGTNKPVWIVVDPEELFSGNKEQFAGQYRFVKIPKYTNVAFSIFNLAISVREMK